MEKHSCKLCFKSFDNGRALGGHMRSHVAATTKPAAVRLSPPPESSSSSRYADDDDDEPKGMAMGTLGYGLRENPKKSFRLVDPEFSSAFPAADAAGSSVVVQDGESETESSRVSTIHRRRSKRARKSASPIPDPPPAPEPETVSSVSDTTAEADVAISLMMLSRDFWIPMTTKSESEQNHGYFIDDEDEIDANVSRLKAAKGRSRYQCGTCKKVFRSYQALGGHRAGHKKKNGCFPVKASAQIQIRDAESPEARVQHECLVCHRVFSSGQSLGGHKRSHLGSPSAAAATIASASKFGESLIDLNLPAPMEDDAEVSAVSDAEFVMARSSKL